MKTILGAVALAVALTGVGAEKLALPFDRTVVVKGADISADFAVKELNTIVSNATGRVFVESGAAGVRALPCENGSDMAGAHSGRPAAFSSAAHGSGGRTRIRFR